MRFGLTMVTSNWVVGAKNRFIFIRPRVVWKNPVSPSKYKSDAYIYVYIYIKGARIFIKFNGRTARFGFDAV